MEKRNTIQKTLVLETVRALACHPTADEVYEQVVKNHPSVSKATVYRNLHTLCESGDLRRVPMPDTADKFDHNAYGHYHIQCEKCGAFSDAPCEYDEKIDTGIEKETGYTGAKHNMFITGVCPKCAG